MVTDSEVLWTGSSQNSPNHSCHQELGWVSSPFPAPAELPPTAQRAAHLRPWGSWVWTWLCETCGSPGAVWGSPVHWPIGVGALLAPCWARAHRCCHLLQAGYVRGTPAISHEPPRSSQPSGEQTGCWGRRGAERLPGGGVAVGLSPASLPGFPAGPLSCPVLREGSTGSVRLPTHSWRVPVRPRKAGARRGPGLTGLSAVPSASRSLQQGKSSSTGNLLDKEDLALPPPDYGTSSRAFPAPTASTFKQRPYSVAVPAFSQVSRGAAWVPRGCWAQGWASRLHPAVATSRTTALCRRRTLTKARRPPLPFPRAGVSLTQTALDTTEGHVSGSLSLRAGAPASRVPEGAGCCHSRPRPSGGG